MRRYKNGSPQNGSPQAEQKFDQIPAPPTPLYPPLAEYASISANPGPYVGPTTESNWVIPGRLLVGAYPGVTDDDENMSLIWSILSCRVTVRHQHAIRVLPAAAQKGELEERTCLTRTTGPAAPTSSIDFEHLKWENCAHTHYTTLNHAAFTSPTPSSEHPLFTRVHDRRSCASKSSTPGPR